MKFKRIAVISRDSGQGEVWRAKSEDGVEVAIKYVKLPVAIADVGTELKRFEREISCMKQLDHHNIVKIIASNMRSDPPFFIMPLASGSLRDLLPLHPDGMPESEAVEMMLTVLDAIAYAHRKKVLHRDLKPENILIYGDQPSIADFGLGRRLQSGSTTITMANVGLGTLQYSAPEQLINGHDGDERSDVYSLGRVFYEMLTGKVPFPRMDLQLVPAKFRHVVFTATRDDPDARYKSVAAMIHDLKVVVNNYESMRTPLQRASGLFAALASDAGGSSADAQALSRLLIEHGDDAELFGELSKKVTPELAAALGAVSIDSYEQIVMAYDRFANSHHDWDFCDTVADVLVSLYGATTSTELRTTILRRLMLLGKAHNRFYVADQFAKIAASSFEEQVYVQIIAGLLHENPDCKEFLRFALGKKSLPPMIVQELAA
jgi:serine/threonine protein kinase